VLPILILLAPFTAAATAAGAPPTLFVKPLAGQTGVGHASPARKAFTPAAAQIIKALATEGVGVYASPASTTPIDPITAPAVPMRLLKSQAIVDASEIAAGEGIRGSDINQLLPMPAAPGGQVNPPFDFLLAAYAENYTPTPGAFFSAQLLENQDLTHPDNIVFPSVVLTLFSADAMRAAGTANKAVAARLQLSDSAAVPNISAGEACSAISDWVSKAFNSAFDALTVGPSSNAALSFLGGVWNSAVALAKKSITDVASVLTAPVLTVIRSSMGTIGVVAWAVSALRNLSVTSVANPAYNSFAIDPAQPSSGKVTITVGSPNGFDWPAGISKCAEQFGLSLPSLNSVVGRSVNWTLADINGVPTKTWCNGTQSCVLATEDAAGTQTSLDANHMATLSYKTNTEAADQDARGEPITTDSVLVKGTVTLDTAKIQSLLKGLLLGSVPGAVNVVAGPLFNSLTSTALKQIASLAQPSLFRYILMDHHQIPALLPERSCTGIFGGGDFVGSYLTHEADTSEGFFSICTFYNPCGDSCVDGAFIATVTLSYLPSVALAHKFFVDDALPGIASVPNVADEAKAETSLPKSPCDPQHNTSCTFTAAAVRVANDILELDWVAPSKYVPNSASALSLLEAAVPRLCPKCKFPTSPAP